MSELLTVKGIGPAIATPLEEADIKTVDKLAITSPIRIKSIVGCSINVATKIIEEAKKMVEDDVVITTADKVMEDRAKRIKYIPTGISGLDVVIKGGIETDAITGLTGEFGVGKSELAGSVVINNKTILNRETAWIETEPQTFRGERFEEIAKARGVDFSAKSVWVVESKYIKSPDQQFRAYEKVEKIIESGHDIGLLVIDSFNALFRMKYTGRETLPLRSGDVAQHLGFLQYLASKYNMAIVLTIQVMGVPDTKVQGSVQKKMGMRFAPVGPHILKHGVNWWLSLSHTSSRDDIFWGRVTIADAPVARASVDFKITSAGVGDIETKRGKA